MPGLKPCPFCGNSNTFYECNMYVKCRVCGSSGPDSDDDDNYKYNHLTQVAAWNTRAITAEVGSVLKETQESLKETENEVEELLKSNEHLRVNMAQKLDMITILEQKIEDKKLTIRINENNLEQLQDQVEYLKEEISKRDEENKRLKQSLIICSNAIKMTGVDK